jgi:hypothetical protein
MTFSTDRHNAVMCPTGARCVFSGMVRSCTVAFQTSGKQRGANAPHVTRTLRMAEGRVDMAWNSLDSLDL